MWCTIYNLRNVLMADSLKVLMMGGPRSGKTSALAGLVDTMINGEVRNLIEVKDVTQIDAVRQKLAQKVENLKNTLKDSLGKYIIVDDSKTENYQHYTVEFAIPGTKDKLNIVFTDANGEFFESGRSHESEIAKIIKDYDVFVIAIDTPSLMEAVNPDNPLMNEPINKAINNVNDIHNFITYLDDKNGADAKMVVFVPLKCEKWAHAGELEKVCDRVKEVYNTPIKALESKKNVEIDILPIQTVGNIVFQEHQKSLLCLTEGDSPQRCSIIEGKTTVRFSDGRERLIDKLSDRFIPDPQAPVKDGSSILRPNSWFRVISKDYAPHNCDQLAFYVLQFILSKYLFIKEVEQKKKKAKRSGRSFFRSIITLAIALISWPAALVYFVVNKVIDYMGTISYDELHKVVTAFNDKHYIKTCGEGICQIKKPLLSV